MDGAFDDPLSTHFGARVAYHCHLYCLETLAGLGPDAQTTFDVLQTLVQGFQIVTLKEGLED